MRLHSEFLRPWGIDPEDLFERLNLGGVRVANNHAAGWASPGNVVSAEIHVCVLHRTFGAVIREMFASGGAGVAPPRKLTVYTVEKPTEEGFVDKDWPEEPGTMMHLDVHTPADARGWVNELIGLRSASTGGMGRFYQIGPWVVKVVAHKKGDEDGGVGYAYTFGGLSNGPNVTGYRQRGSRYAQLMEQVKVDGFYLSNALAKLYRGQPEAVLEVNGYGANLLVAAGICEAARNYNTWGVNLMLLDMMHEVNASNREGKTVPLDWDVLLEQGMHPMARGGGTKHMSSETATLEAAVLRSWLDTRTLAIANKNPAYTQLQTGVTCGTPPSNAQVLSTRQRYRAKVLASLHAMLALRFSDVESLYPFESRLGL
jgi:hypothetical protein